jgi:hypothetical protein
MTADPSIDGTHRYVQFAPPLAGCHDAPPSTETSTPATTPDVSVAVPVITTSVSAATLAPAVGKVIVEPGRLVSVEVVANVRPGCNVPGCVLPMSANKLTIACRMA